MSELPRALRIEIVLLDIRGTLQGTLARWTGATLDDTSTQAQRNEAELIRRKVLNEILRIDWALAPGDASADLSSGGLTPSPPGIDRRTLN